MTNVLTRVSVGITSLNVEIDLIGVSTTKLVTLCSGDVQTLANSIMCVQWPPVVSVMCKVRARQC